MGQSYGDLFASWEISVCKSLISEFKRKYPWLKLEAEDLLQECLSHWYLKRQAYDQARGSAKAYLRQVVKHKLLSILRHELAARRGSGKVLLSLDEPLGETEIPLADTIPAGEVPIDIRVDVRLAMEHLTPFQKELCRLLSQGYPVAEAARVLGKSRRAVRDEIGKVRRIFSQKRLDDYLG